MQTAWIKIRPDILYALNWVQTVYKGNQQMTASQGSRDGYTYNNEKEHIFSVCTVKGPLSKRPKLGFQDLLWLNAGQKYCRMLQGKHSAILSTFIKLPFVIKTFDLLFLSCRFTHVLPYFYRKCFQTIIALYCKFS